MSIVRFALAAIISLIIGMTYSPFATATTVEVSPSIFKPSDNLSVQIKAPIYFLDDPEAKWTIDDVAKGNAGDFKVLQKLNLGFGYKGVMWLRLTVQAPELKDPYWFLTQNFEHIGRLTLYRPTAQNSFDALDITEFVKVGERDIPIHNFVFPVQANSSSPATYYLRLDPAGHGLSVDLTYHTLPGFIAYVTHHHLAIGLFFGCLIIMWFYNAVIFSVIRSRVYFYYLYYLAGFIIVFVYLNGFGPYISGMSPFMDRFYCAFGFVAVHGMTLFARKFLSLPSHLPKLDLYLRICQWGLVLGCLISFFVSTNPFVILNPLILITVPFLIYGGIRRSLDKYSPAYIYTAGWIFFIISLITYSLRALGVIPANFFTTYGLMIASVWEAVLFAFALGFRLKLIEQEKTEIVAQQKRREIEILEHERAVLEDRVQQRTEELEVSLKELSQKQCHIEKINSDRKLLIANTNLKIEAELKRIALDIHDTLNTVVLSIKGNAGETKTMLMKSAHADTLHAAISNMSTIEDKSNYLYSLSRDLISKLRSEILDAFGLAEAIEDLLIQQSKLHPTCNYQYHVSEHFPTLDETFNIVTYRIVQESLSNVMKHANATECNINLTHEEKNGRYQISLEIRDNGLGFDPITVAKSIGLIGMRERGESINGDLQIDSSAGNGTRILFSCTVPI